MKTYTFKIKYRKVNNLNEIEQKVNVPTIITCIHCPFEIFFDSVKQTNELVFALENILKNDENCELYVTICDYLNSDDEYIEKDYVLCHISAILESKDLKEFFSHKNCYGVI